MDLFAFPLHWFVTITFVTVIAYAAVSDFLSQIIPNWTAIVLALLFLPAGYLWQLGGAEIALRYSVGLSLFAGGALLFTGGILGGGDVKLIAATGLWFGWKSVLAYLFAVTLMGGVLAITVIILKKYFSAAPFLAGLPWMSGAEGQGQSLPYGVAIGAASIFLFFKLGLGQTL